MLDQLHDIAKTHGFSTQALQDLERLFAASMPRVPTARLENDDHDIQLAPRSPTEFTARYQIVELIGTGGFSEVHEAWDRHVHRRVALKIQLPSASLSEDTVRFRQEVRLMAKLQHPGIVPIYDWGELPDGRIWLTMKRILGETIAKKMARLHLLRGAEFVLGLRELIGAFLRLCEAIAYAHAQGIIHRDLSPQNLMTGAYGEVHVVDWGLARDVSFIAGHASSATSEAAAEPTDAAAPKLRTRIAGTPYYTPPEQARGDLATLCPASDVYTLGAVLYEILCGQPPYWSESAATDGPQRILRRVLDGPPRPIDAMARPDAPQELRALCARAMARDPRDRPEDAGAFGEAIRDWLDGANRLARARRIVEDAHHEHRASIESLRQKSESLRAQARTILGRLHSFDPAQQKAEGWALEDQAATLERDILREEITWTQKIRSALNEAPDLEEAHIALADHYAQSLHRAETEHNDSSALSYAALLESHASKTNTETRDRYAKLLQGDGCLTLVTLPECANLRIAPYHAVHRYLMPNLGKAILTHCPLHEFPLPRGSYLVEVTMPGYHRAAYPVFLGRGEHWTGVRPGETNPYPIQLLRKDELQTDEAYIPAGWFVAGGDPHAGESSPRQRIWVDAFVIKRHPVTSAEYIEFLNDLVTSGQASEAQKHCPLKFPGSSARDDELFEYVCDASTGRYATRAPEKDLALPVVCISWHSAVAYAAWLARRTGLAWRLPSEFEWEKAARGVDGRFMPWGDQIEPTWACVAGSHPDRKHSMPIHEYPTDISPYGVLGMAGNVRDWCIEPWKLDGPRVENGILHIEPADGQDNIELPVRGGGWISAGDMMRLGVRYAEPPTKRHGVLGFRLVRGIKL